MKHLINKKLLGSIVFALSLAYPLIVYFLGSRLPSSYIVVGLIFLLVIRSAVQYRDQGAGNSYLVLIIAAIMLGCFFLIAE